VLSICPEAVLVDVTHGIGPQNVREGAVVLADVAPWYPAGTIHVVVVDPGVGTSRRMLYAELGDQRLLAPDNGVLSRLMKKSPLRRAIVLENRAFWLADVSSTFHGRDLLSPVAAHVARGADPEELGPAAENLIELAWPEPVVAADRVEGEVLYVDSFGNLITNITAEHLAGRGPRAERIVECAGRRIDGFLSDYGQSWVGDLVALVDSHGRLEVAVVNGNAAQRVEAREGDAVVVF
jgi:S-adenosylmethionine hydrolase